MLWSSFGSHTRTCKSAPFDRFPPAGQSRPWTRTQSGKLQPLASPLAGCSCPEHLVLHSWRCFATFRVTATIQVSCSPTSTAVQVRTGLARLLHHHQLPSFAGAIAWALIRFVHLPFTRVHPIRQHWPQAHWIMKFTVAEARATC